LFALLTKIIDNFNTLDEILKKFLWSFDQLKKKNPRNSITKDLSIVRDEKCEKRNRYRKKIIFYYFFFNVKTTNGFYFPDILFSLLKQCKISLLFQSLVPCISFNAFYRYFWVKACFYIFERKLLLINVLSQSNKLWRLFITLVLKLQTQVTFSVFSACNES